MKPRFPDPLQRCRDTTCNGAAPFSFVRCALTSGGEAMIDREVATTKNKAAELQLAELRIGIGRMIETLQICQATASDPQDARLCSSVADGLKALIRGAAPPSSATGDYIGGAELGPHRGAVDQLIEDAFSSLKAFQRAARAAGLLSTNGKVLHDTTPTPTESSEGVSRSKR